MPKITFFNLNIEKREKIKKAIINEFSKHTIAKASISNIVEEAQIPRGSFYQYFEDKEDALKYIIDEFINIEKEEIKSCISPECYAEMLIAIRDGIVALSLIDDEINIENRLEKSFQTAWKEICRGCCKWKIYLEWA